MDDSHTKSPEEVIQYFKTDENSGLSEEQHKRYVEKYGLNGMYTFQNTFPLNLVKIGFRSSPQQQQSTRPCHAVV